MATDNRNFTINLTELQAKIIYMALMEYEHTGNQLIQKTQLSTGEDAELDVELYTDLIIEINEIEQLKEYIINITQ